jgi:5-methylcytosine-specific restriction enzyme A
MPFKPRDACPVCRRLNCTDPNHKTDPDKWRRARLARPMTNREIVHCRTAVEDWVEVHGPVCPMCGATTYDLTADHIVPVSKGGDPLGPVRVICRSCNARRGNRVG